MKFTDKTFYDGLYPIISDVESVSSVEVVAMVYKQSHHYRENIFMLSSVAAILVSAYMMFSNIVFDPWFIYFVSLGVFSLFFLLFFGFSFFKRLLISKETKSRRPYVIAHSIFSQARMCDTKDRTAVLIFVSLLEQQVVLVVDKGVRESIPKDELDKLRNDFQSVFSSSEPAKAFLDLLKRSKDLFAKYLPVKPGDVNELSNDLFFKVKF